MPPPPPILLELAPRPVVEFALVFPHGFRIQTALRAHAVVAQENLFA